MTKMWIVFTVCVLTFIAGLGLGFQLFKGKETIVEKDRPAIYLHDTSIVLERKTDTVIQTVFEKVKGTSTLHQGSVTIIPTGMDTVVDTIRLGGDTVEIIKTIGCDTVELFYAILQEKDGGIRVQVKSKGGKIVGGIDVPKDKLIVNKPLKNAIGLDGSFAPKDGTWVVGGFYNRTIGCFFIGPTIATKINNYDDIRVGLQAGFRW